MIFLNKGSRTKDLWFDNHNRSIPNQSWKAIKNYIKFIIYNHNFASCKKWKPLSTYHRVLLCTDRWTSHTEALYKGAQSINIHFKRPTAAWCKESSYQVSQPVPLDTVRRPKVLTTSPTHQHLSSSWSQVQLKVYIRYHHLLFSLSDAECSWMFLLIL